jgi:hypothetical protein
LAVKADNGFSSTTRQLVMWVLPTFDQASRLFYVEDGPFLKADYITIVEPN